MISRKPFRRWLDMDSRLLGKRTNYALVEATRSEPCFGQSFVNKERSLHSCTVYSSLPRNRSDMPHGAIFGGAFLGRRSWRYDKGSSKSSLIYHLIYHLRTGEPRR